MAMHQKGLVETLDGIFGKYKGKKVTVLHSGGLDSNIIVAGLYFAGADVNAVSIRSKVLSSSTIEERTRKLFLDRLNAALPDRRNIYSETITFDGRLQGIHRNRFSQMSIWLNMLPLVSREDDDCVVLGYVMSDQGNTMIDNLKRSWRSQAPFLSWGKKLPSLEFPVTRFAKRELINYLQHKCKEKNVPDLIQHIHWFCELQLGSIMSRCGDRCESCKRAKNEKLFDWDIATNLPAIFSTRMELLDFLETNPQESDIRFSKRENCDVDVYLHNLEDKSDNLIHTIEAKHVLSYKGIDAIELPEGADPKEHHLYATLEQVPMIEWFPEMHLPNEETIKLEEVKDEVAAT